MIPDSAAGLPHPLTLSVVIVWYGDPTVRDAVEAVLADPAVAEVILVNNGPGGPGGPAGPACPPPLAGLAVRPGRLRLVHGQGNVGFGAGCTLGAARARGRWLLFLNPDCVPAPDALPRLRALAAGLTDQRWLIGPRLLNPDGTDQRAGRCNAGTPGQWLGEALGGPIARHLGRVTRHRDPLPQTELAETPALCGAFMLMPRRYYTELGGFDPQYFLYFEDLALCRAVWKSGGRVLFAPNVTAIHRKGGSPVPWRVRTAHKIRSFRRFLLSEFGTAGGPRWPLWGLWLLLSAGLVLRPLGTRRTGPGRRPA